MSIIKTIEEDIRNEVGIDLICSLLGKLTNILINVKNDPDIDEETKKKKLEKLKKLLYAIGKERDEAYRGNKDTIQRAYDIYAVFLNFIREDTPKFIESL